MNLIEKFVDWLLGPSDDETNNIDPIPQLEAPAPTIKNIENVEKWLAENNDHQELITYYRYAEKNKVDDELQAMIKKRLIEVCDSISPTLKDVYFPPD